MQDVKPPQIIHHMNQWMISCLMQSGYCPVQEIKTVQANRQYPKRWEFGKVYSADDNSDIS